MHRNTFLVVIILAVVAALLTGINLGKKLSTQSTEPAPQNIITPSPTISPVSVYENTICGITFNFPETVTKTENASGSALFTETTTGNQILAVTCQLEIPTPAVPEENTETKILTNSAGTGTVSATLYHDSSAKDGTPLDVLIFRKPKTATDVYLAGYGEIFNSILQTLRLIP
jgi:hypothetical protein